ncbi:hypothetical protein C8R42DRAFT_725694 [Lentinula raphanica]|nr:hypothetical protein C8R42DRAFT_725694 [Lentinula raphanica]
MSVVTSTALVPASNAVVDSSISPSADEGVAKIVQANFERAVVPYRPMDANDLVLAHPHPVSGEFQFVLNGRTAEALWGALVTRVELIQRADRGRPESTIVSEESLQRVSNHQRTLRVKSLKQSFDFQKLTGRSSSSPIQGIVENLAKTNPLSYPGSRNAVIDSYYGARDLLEDLARWSAACQIEAHQLEIQGIYSGWDWRSALKDYIIPRNGQRLQVTDESYNPRLPSFDPRLIRNSPEEPMQVDEYEQNTSMTQAVVLHPTESHYSQHFPEFDPFSGLPQKEVVGCSGRGSCSLNLEFSDKN